MENTNENKVTNFEMDRFTVLQEMQDRFNGCPLFNEREKGDWDAVVDMILTVEDIFPLTDYHVVTFKEIEDKFFLTGGAMKELCNNYERKYVLDLIVKPLAKVRTKSNRDYRPIEVLGYAKA